MDKSEDAAIAPLQLAAVVAEVGGGIGLILGLLTPLWNLMILTTMAVAIRKHIGEGGAFVGGKGAWELAGMHAAISIVLLLGGPGRWSVDFFLFGRRRGEAPPA
jgi:putative oxidoreductase